MRDPCELRDVLLETYAVNDAMNQLILARLDPRAWRAEGWRVPDEYSTRRPPSPVSGSRPGAPGRGGRTIAALYAHLHNCRVAWLRRNAPHLKCPAPLDPYRCTRKQAASAHKKSAAQCLLMLKDALGDAPDRKVTKFTRDSWTRTWPAGGAMFLYMFSHEAHHRGQILMLAHQLGYRVPPREWGLIWNWDRLWKEQGFTTRPR